MGLTTTVDANLAAEVAAVEQLHRPVVVLVDRDGHGWRAEVAALGVVRRARSLVTLDRRVRQLVGPDFVDYQFHTGDAVLDRLVLQVRAARAAVRMNQARARQLTERALALPTGGPVRDLAVLLDLSHQRVHQLLGQSNQSRLEGVRQRGSGIQQRRTQGPV